MSCGRRISRPGRRQFYSTFPRIAPFFTCSGDFFCRGVPFPPQGSPFQGRLSRTLQSTEDSQRPPPSRTGSPPFTGLSRGCTSLLRPAHATSSEKALQASSPPGAHGESGTEGPPLRCVARSRAKRREANKIEQPDHFPQGDQRPIFLSKLGPAGRDCPPGGGIPRGCSSSVSSKSETRAPGNVF